MVPGPVDQRRIGVRNGLQMDIAAEIMVLAQAARDLDDPFHRIIGRADDAGGEEQALDMIAPEKARVSRTTSCAVKRARRTFELLRLASAA
jgi:hypothetical protein